MTSQTTCCQEHLRKVRQGKGMRKHPTEDGRGRADPLRKYNDIPIVSGDRAIIRASV